MDQVCRVLFVFEWIDTAQIGIIVLSAIDLVDAQTFTIPSTPSQPSESLPKFMVDLHAVETSTSTLTQLIKITPSVLSPST